MAYNIPLQYTSGRRDFRGYGKRFRGVPRFFVNSLFSHVGTRPRPVFGVADFQLVINYGVEM